MTSFFSSGFFGFGKKRSSNKKFARNLDDDTDKEKSYPRAKSTGLLKAKMMMDESPFAGATPAATGSWIACHDIDGNPYWWNDVTGEWTYQLYSTSSYTPPHMLPSYLYQQQYGPQYVLGHQQQQQQQQQPYLGSPSGAHHQSPWGPMVVPGMGFGGQEQGDGFANQSETWEKFVDSNGRPFWIHSATGQRAAGYASS